MSQTSFNMDADTQQAIDELKKFFGVKTNSAVIKNALALAQVASESADDKKNLTILDKKENREKVIVISRGA